MDHPVRRLCAAVSTAPPGSGDPAPPGPPGRLAATVGDACARAGLERVFLQEEPGFGLVLIMPSGLHEARAVRDLTTELSRALPGGDALRLAFHQGLIELRGGRFTGRAIESARSLCELRVLDGDWPPAPFRRLTVLISDGLFEDLAAASCPLLPLARFRRVLLLVACRPEAAWCALFGPDEGLTPR